MASTTLYIRNMVCDRCIRVVREEIENLGHPINSIELGRVDIRKEISEPELGQIGQVLLENGFELIDDKKSRVIERIKTLIIEWIHHSKEVGGRVNISDFLSHELGYDYTYLSRQFSSVEGVTIERYIIRQKIEKVKELMMYDELSLKEIAYQLDYSSEQHLSAQFKKETGLSPSRFKQVKGGRRKPIDQV